MKKLSMLVLLIVGVAVTALGIALVKSVPSSGFASLFGMFK